MNDANGLTATRGRATTTSGHSRTRENIQEASTGDFFRDENEKKPTFGPVQKVFESDLYDLLISPQSICLHIAISFCFFIQHDRERASTSLFPPPITRREGPRLLAGRPTSYRRPEYIRVNHPDLALFGVAQTGFTYSARFFGWSHHAAAQNLFFSRGDRLHHYTRYLSRSAATWVSLRPVPWTSAVWRVLETRFGRCKGVKLVDFELRGVASWIPGQSLGLGKLTWRLSLTLRFPLSFRPVCLVETINATFLSLLKSPVAPAASHVGSVVRDRNTERPEWKPRLYPI